MTHKTLLNASNTLYVDFESNKAGELFLVGFDGGSGYTTWILHEELRGWAEGKGFRFATLDDVLDLVCQYNTIVAYSTMEKTVLNRIASERGRVLPSGIAYLNARKVAVTWANKTRKAELENLPIRGKQVDRYVRPKKNALVGLARLVGMHSSATHGFGVVTKRIGQVRKGLAAKSGQFEQLTLDILPALKDGYSLYRTAMPDRKDVLGRVHIAVVSDTTPTASPFSYSQA